jgi:DNA repair exonuclease SbcCD ATPase subunit
VTEDQPGERPDEDDYDLLTYGEAGARLAGEIRKERAHLEELEERMQVTDSDLAHEIAAVQKRIDELKDAAERQTTQQREARDFERFFGYDPKAGRS